ncbi:MAG: site-specific DNA-methyltransferase [Candidatus Didemnitutus sp.]|nr:site-specific DNA-methyltransferase [Candidatus Didemnitutus sp.]
MPKKSPRNVNEVGADTPNRPKRLRPPGDYPTYDDAFRPEDAIVAEAPGVVQPSQLLLRDDTRGLYLYHGDCLEVMERLAAKHPGGVFDLIFADPPYFLSNGGITCHAGKMVKVDKGEWDKSRGPELNHEFNTEWLKRCQKLLKPNGTIWVSGTHHVIFSVGYAMQQLGMKLLNQVTWQKPNPPPNLACRYFTHSTETLLWAAKDAKSRHRFNYADMKRANGGKQMKDVWTFTAPKNAEKSLGKHPTQKPLALLERILLASTAPGDLVMDPFLGSGTAGVACVVHCRRFVGIERDAHYIQLSLQRLEAVGFTLDVEIHLTLFATNDLELISDRIDPIPTMSTEGSPTTERVFHESKFVFLSCAPVASARVVHTTVDTSLQEAWAHAPDGKKRQTTHIVRCETEIFSLKTN